MEKQVYTLLVSIEDEGMRFSKNTPVTVNGVECELISVAFYNVFEELDRLQQEASE